MQIQELYHLIENPSELNENTLQELEQITSEFPYFQAAWMLYLKNLKKIVHPDYLKTIKTVAVAVPDRKKLYRFLNEENVISTADYYFAQNKKVESGNLSNENSEGGSLIDKFLSSDIAPIRVGKKQDDEPVEETNNEIVEKSATESDELVTETLAMIYFEQKKYDKALDAFEKLSLKYPEKSVYFATRIEEIEKLKNI